MSDNYEIPAQTHIRTSDLPDFVGIIPKSILDNRFYGCEDQDDTVVIHCNLVCKAEGSDKDKVVGYDKHLVLSRDQFEQFEIALFESDNACVLFKSSGGWNPSYTFSAGEGFDNRKEHYVTKIHKITAPSGFIGRLLNFPSELRQLLTLVHNILETHKTVRNVVEVKYDRSNIRKIKEDMREWKDKAKKAKYELEFCVDERKNDRATYQKTYGKMKVVNDQLLNKVLELENHLSRQEEDILREAEKIKSRISAEEQHKIGGKS